MVSTLIPKGFEFPLLSSQYLPLGTHGQLEVLEAWWHPRTEAGSSPIVVVSVVGFRLFMGPS